MEICVHCECGAESNEQHKPVKALDYDQQIQSVIKYSDAVVINLHKFYSHCIGLKKMQDYLWPDSAKNIVACCQGENENKELQPCYNRLKGQMSKQRTCPILYSV